MAKISTEQFLKIKDEMIKIISSQYSNLSYEDEQQLVKRYFELEDVLTSFDLSDISFELWEGIELISSEEYKLDFSHTNANIDLNLLEDLNGNNFDFHGCNIRGLEKFPAGAFHSNVFDDELVNANSDIFLSNLFDDEFKDKYYFGKLKMDDLCNLSVSQLDELKKKRVENKVDSSISTLFYYLGASVCISLYNYSPADFRSVLQIFEKSNGIFEHNFFDFTRSLENVDVSLMKEYCYSEVMKNVLSAPNIKLEALPEDFLNENRELFLLDSGLNQEVKNKYYDRTLTLDEVLENIDYFDNIPVEYRINLGEYSDKVSYWELKDHLTNVWKFCRLFGDANFVKVLKNHPDVVKHILSSNVGEIKSFINLWGDSSYSEMHFLNVVKLFMLKHGSAHYYMEDEKMVYDIPEWANSIHFNAVPKLKDMNDLLNLQGLENIFVLDYSQQMMINLFGIDNIIKFGEENDFFAHNLLNAIDAHFKSHDFSYFSNLGFSLANDNLAYSDFLQQFAKLLDDMRAKRLFVKYPNYDWMRGEFRDAHPEIFMDLDANSELRNAFYVYIKPDFLYKHKEYIPYLVDKNLVNTIGASMGLVLPSLDGDGRDFTQQRTVNFIEEYVLRYGNEKLLNLIAKYGDVLSDITIYSLSGEIENEEAIEKSIRNAIYEKIKNVNMKYGYLSNIMELVLEHPDVFVDFDSMSNISDDEKQTLKNAFYDKSFNFGYIKKYPELVTMLKNKDLRVAFGNIRYQGYKDLELMQVFGNEMFLELCLRYGRYMEGIVDYLKKDNVDFKEAISFDALSWHIENIISRESILGNINYQPEDAPTFLKEKHPELFLSDDAPDNLKNYFYNKFFNLTFEELSLHKEWMPYLVDKSVGTSLLRGAWNKEYLLNYFETFGVNKAIKIGLSKTSTVDKMINENKIELMKNWYDKTGGKFVPDCVIMLNFDLDDADKFLVSMQNWSNLMRIREFSKTFESREAMLKLAYSFGAFDQDVRGFKMVYELLTRIPRKLENNQMFAIKNINTQINKISGREMFFQVDDDSKQVENGNNGAINNKDLGRKYFEENQEKYDKMIKYLRNNPVDNSVISNEEMVLFFENMRSEKVNIDFSSDIFSQLYKQNEDGTFTLAINQQSYPKTSQSIRVMLERFTTISMLTPDKAHQLFGRFSLKYDADFREFLLNNFDEILANPNYTSIISSIQNQFDEIKVFNSNRNLTLDAAVSFINSNRFTGINTGNDRVAEISAIANYSQREFEILQQIFNYGKQRTFSSIPRIEKSNEKYDYSILRLDEALAMAGGTLSDCCQEINNCAELCMEHSMVSKHGRLFLVTDKLGNFAAQSWVWRNKDVLCFDNIEIPDKAFTRALHSGMEREEFTDEIYNVYKKAAVELIEEDERVYRKMLEDGKISQQQYDGLRLGKVTVGLGHNDIASSLKKNSLQDKGEITRPLPFHEPVKLSRGLYTSDSNMQFILEERDDRRQYDGDTLALHNDEYIQYDDSNFNKKLLLVLEKLELVTKDNLSEMETNVDVVDNSENIVTRISQNYGLNSDTTRIIMNPNFAIIYDTNSSTVRIADLFFNTKVDNDLQQLDIEDTVVMQIRLALEQISSDLNFDISLLNEKQKEMYNKAISLTDEMDIERGVRHAK